MRHVITRLTIKISIAFCTTLPCCLASITFMGSARTFCFNVPGGCGAVSGYGDNLFPDDPLMIYERSVIISSPFSNANATSVAAAWTSTTLTSASGSTVQIGDLTQGGSGQAEAHTIVRDNIFIEGAIQPSLAAIDIWLDGIATGVSEAGVPVSEGLFAQDFIFQGSGYSQAIMSGTGGPIPPIGSVTLFNCAYLFNKSYRYSVENPGSSLGWKIEQVAAAGATRGFAGGGAAFSIGNLRLFAPAQSFRTSLDSDPELVDVTNLLSISSASGYDYTTSLRPPLAFVPEPATITTTIFACSAFFGFALRKLSRRPLNN